MNPSRQWAVVAGVVGLLGIGATVMVRYGGDAARVEVGAPAPEFKVYSVSTGDSVRFREKYRGQVTLVNIWATWCVPCKVEMPSMQRLYDSLGPRGFRIAAVSIDADGPETVRSFASELHLNFDLLQDRTGRIQETYQTTGVPESFLVNREGVIVKRVIGAHDWASEVNRSLVIRLLQEPGP